MGSEGRVEGVLVVMAWEFGRFVINCPRPAICHKSTRPPNATLGTLNQAMDTLGKPEKDAEKSPDGS